MQASDFVSPGGSVGQLPEEGGVNNMIVVSISKNLTRVTKGDEAFEVEGETLGDCLNDLAGIVPRLKDELFASSGDRLLERVQVKVNRKIVEGEDLLATKIQDGDKIDIALKGY